MILRIVAALLTLALLTLALGTGGALAQGTQLSPPGVRWGGAGVQVPGPVQVIGYDSVTGLPCIVGSAATCSLGTAVTPAAPGLAPVASAALEASHVLKAAPGSLYDFQASFVACATAPCWVMLFDAVAAPSNGAVTPKKWWQVGPNQTIGVTWAPGPPLPLAAGITVGCSTTGPFTFTATAQCAISGEVQ